MMADMPDPGHTSKIRERSREEMNTMDYLQKIEKGTEPSNLKRNHCDMDPTEDSFSGERGLMDVDSNLRREEAQSHDIIPPQSNMPQLTAQQEQNRTEWELALTTEPDINQEAKDAEVCEIESGSVIGIPPYALESTGAESTLPYALESTGRDRYHFGSNEHK